MANKKGECIHCGKLRWLIGRGLCSGCYDKHRDEYPSMRGKGKRKKKEDAQVDPLADNLPEMSDEEAEAVYDEANAIGLVYAALKPLDGPSRKRVIDYVCARLSGK